MTAPQDPNQPSAPGPAGEPAPGWGAPPPETAPGWAAPQPGWGSAQPPPQPGYPPQPGWGTPQPGWGTPQPGWGPQPGWPPPPARSSKKGCWIAVIAGVVVLGIIGLLVVSCALTLGPALSTGMAIQNNSGGRITSVEYNWVNGTGTYNITVRPGVAAEEARQIACQVVRPTLKGTQFENTHFVIYAWNGYLLASDLSSC